MAEIDLIALAINIIVRIIILAPVLWIAGRWLAGREHAKFTDAIWIVVLGTIIGTLVQAAFDAFEFVGLVGSLLSSLIVLIVWLGLIKHFFDTGWLKALAIAIIVVIIYVIITIILILLGLAIAIGGALFT